AAPGQIEDGVDDLTHRIGARPSGLSVAMRKQVLDVRPLNIREITGIPLPCFHARKVTERPSRRQGDFLDGPLSPPAPAGPAGARATLESADERAASANVDDAQQRRRSTARRCSRRTGGA